MRRFRAATALLFLLTLSLSACSAAGADEEEEDQNFVPGEIMVRFEEDITEETAREIVGSLDLAWKKYLSETAKIALVGVPVGEEEAWVEKVKEEPQVEEASVNHNNIELR